MTFRVLKGQIHIVLFNIYDLVWNWIYIYIADVNKMFSKMLNNNLQKKGGQSAQTHNECTIWNCQVCKFMPCLVGKLIFICQKMHLIAFFYIRNINYKNINN